MCACKGESIDEHIEPPAGVLDDGSRCATVFSLKADVATEALRLTVVKPGVHRYPLMLHTRATGDNGFNATFSRSTVLKREGKVVAQWDDGLHGRVFGVAFEWDTPQPASVAPMELDAATLHAAIDHKFTLSLRCEPNATSYRKLQHDLSARRRHDRDDDLHHSAGRECHAERAF